MIANGSVTDIPSKSTNLKYDPDYISFQIYNDQVLRKSEKRAKGQIGNCSKNRIESISSIN